MNGNPAAGDRDEAWAASLLGVNSATGLMMAGFHLAGRTLAVAPAAPLAAGPGRRSARGGAAGADPGAKAGRLAFLSAAVIACGMLGLESRQPRPGSEALPRLGIGIVLMVAASVGGVILGFPATFAPGPAPGPSLGAGVPDIPPHAGGFVAEFEGVTRRLGDLHGGGHPVGVLNPSDTVYDLASGVPPGDRDSPPLACAIWKDEVAQRMERLRASGQEWIAMRSPPDRRKFFVVPTLHDDDTLDQLRMVLEQEYDPVDRIGTFEFWRRKSPRQPVLREKTP